MHMSQINYLVPQYIIQTLLNDIQFFFVSILPTTY